MEPFERSTVSLIARHVTGDQTLLESPIRSSGQAAVASPNASRSRTAIFSTFFVHGSAFGTWSSLIPTVKARLSISESQFGWSLFMIVVGSLLAMLASRSLIARFGSRQVVRVAGPILLTTVVLATFTHVPFVFALVLLVLGLAGNTMDVAMNAQAVEAERSSERALMSSFHAMWSLGGLTGAVLGGLLVKNAGGSLGALIAVVLLSALFEANQGKLLAAGPPHGTVAARPLSAKWLLIVAGLLAGVCMSTDAAVRDWSPLYLTGNLALDLGYSGVGYGAFASSMALCRLAGDRVRTSVGERQLLAISACLAIIGLAIVAFAKVAPIALSGFVLLGIGVANIFPTLLSMAGRRGGASGIVVVFATGYLIALAAAPSFGTLAEATSLANIYLLLAAMFALAGTAALHIASRN
ncbi:MFS transporter [Mesorhizobium sp. M3A.F.Ca.ET.174.01.1.1]|nr:MAG: MFS transporter [Mesorhizobium sp.]RWB90804.1 MAG: MFS transporter [Mesorhizobium sp.]TGS85822.1 MFS transporter [Mesorhizobium sp. M3A.F.Ca.ET.175.01.1.1]TGT23868.1 MFS transporter [Mesorhizobium sp. M3A.F.Ca.ET.174.01.1.1]